MNEWMALEQAERVKKWCREYGVGIVVGIILAILGSVGWHYGQQTREQHRITASIQYEKLSDALIKNENTATINALANELLKNYPRTPYACLAALQLAKQAIYQNNLAEAEKQLFWIIRQGKDKTLEIVARLRLARVLLADNQAKRALNLLTKSQNKAYSPLLLEEKGDILLQLGRRKEALQSYVDASKSFSERAMVQPLLTMKINNLAEA